VSRICTQIVVIATGPRADGHREVLGLDVGDSENETFWREFPTSVTDRGLAGARLVISDAHAGLIRRSAAASKALHGTAAAFTRCATCCPRRTTATVR
jgi:transposase-like protein